MDLVEFCYICDETDINDCHMDICPVIDLCRNDAQSYLMTHYAEGEI